LKKKGRDLSNIGDSGTHRATRAIASFSGNQGKVYWQARINDLGQEGHIMFGIVTDDFCLNGDMPYPGRTADSFGYYANTGFKYTKGSGHEFSTPSKVGDIIGTLINLSTKTITFFRNGLIMGTAFNNVPQNKPIYPCISLYELGNSVSFCDFNDSPSFETQTSERVTERVSERQPENKTVTPTPTPTQTVTPFTQSNDQTPFANGFVRSPTTFDQF